MSGLSQARKVPDRRLKREAPSRVAPKRDEKINKEKELERAKCATKIQAVGRGYMARFAFKSMLTLEQTKKKFFAVQIQALARGYLVRLKRRN
jgi:IQ calmodulin-binding motif